MVSMFSPLIYNTLESETGSSIQGWLRLISGQTHAKSFNFFSKLVYFFPECTVMLSHLPPRWLVALLSTLTMPAWLQAENTTRPWASPHPSQPTSLQLIPPNFT